MFKTESTSKRIVLLTSDIPPEPTLVAVAEPHVYAVGGVQGVLL